MIDTNSAVLLPETENQEVIEEQFDNVKAEVNSGPLCDIAEQICKKRYYQRDKDGNIIEDWHGLVTRVVNHVCQNEDQEFKDEMFDIIYSTKFLPNSPCLVNAGRKGPSGLLACHVSAPPGDSWKEIARNIADFGAIARRGGGNGTCFSFIRPAGDAVFGSTHAKACGPIEVMRMTSEAMHSITQSGFRSMANLASLHVWHPDIKQFITCKQRERALKTYLREDIYNHYEQLNGQTHDHLNIVLDKFISNFNISVMVSNRFMEAVENDCDWNLEFGGKIYETVKAREIFNLIAYNAWRNGDPGLLFDDAINDGPYKYSGQKIDATNPCFHPDTLIAVADGRGSVSIRQLAEEGVDVPVYCCNPQTSDIVIRWGRKPRLTRKNQQLVRVTFDDGGSVVTTPDHKILLRNGQYKEVCNLRAGDSIMPMTKFEYIHKRCRYFGIVRGDGRPTKTEHRMIYEFHNNELSTDEVIHHRDFNGLNNNINNLQKMTQSEHSQYHRQFNNPMTHWYPSLSPEEREQYRERMSLVTTGEKNGMFGKQHSEETKKKIGLKTTQRQTEEYIEKIKLKLQNYWQDDERKKKQSEAKKKHWEMGLYDSLKKSITITDNHEDVDKLGAKINNIGSQESSLTETSNNHDYEFLDDLIRNDMVHNIKLPVPKNEKPKLICKFCKHQFAPKYGDKYCTIECANLDIITEEEVLDNFMLFIDRYGIYPTVVQWETFEDAICSREVIRRRFGDFVTACDILVDRGIFARLQPNAKLSKKTIIGAIVQWTIENGKEPSRKDCLQICSLQSLLRNGGYDKLVKEARLLCLEQMVNHKVVSVEVLQEISDVYNITVDEHHNLCIVSSDIRKKNKHSQDVSRLYAVVYKNCGEQPLPSIRPTKENESNSDKGGSSCNLGSIDISKFYKHDTDDVDWTSFKYTIEHCVQFLDDVIDVNVFPTTAFAEWAYENRPVGLGIMGWADLLLKMKIEYGSEESTKLAERVAKFMEDIAHIKSVELASLKGTPKSCQYKELEFRRNVTLTSIAPTGTISLLSNCSSSIEPIFSPIMYRTDNTGQYTIAHIDADKPYFKCAVDNVMPEREVTWERHVRMQAAWQNYNSSGISKTINLPNSATIEDVKGAYMLAWKLKCKGITVYRDGSKTTQVLNTKKQTHINHAVKRPESVPAQIFKTTAIGHEWHVIVGLVNEVPYEMFAVNGKQELPTTGHVVKQKKKHYALTDEQGNILIDNIAKEEDLIDPKIGLETRRFSLELRHGIPTKYIVEQIDKANEVVTSFSKAVGRVFKNHFLSEEDKKSLMAGIACPECVKSGQENVMVSEAGCFKCLVCGHSRCG